MYSITCIKCKIKKDSSAYYKHSQTHDWFLHKCKDCCKNYQHSRDTRSIDSKRYYNNPQRREYVKVMASLRRKKKWYWSIHLKTSRWITKKNIRPLVCPICLWDSNCDRVESHHINYDEWNKIVFCCSFCHKKIHFWEIPVKEEMIIDLLT